MTMNTRTAHYISVLGHPLLTVPICSIVALFKFEQANKAFFVSSLIVGAILVPLAVKNYMGFKKGIYTNFDVSDQIQRQSWYVFPILLLILVTVILFVTEQSRALRLYVLFSLALLVILQIVNNFIKISLHVSFNAFMSFLMMQINVYIGILYLLFTALVSLSRLILKRHTHMEVIAGAVIGLAMGILSWVYV